MNYFQKAINNFLQIKKYFKVKKNNKIDISTNLKNSKIIIKGDKNLVLIKKSDIKRLKVGIYGKNNTLEIYENCMLRDTNIIIQGNNLRITIKNNCEIGGATIVCAGESSSIQIDEQCLIASNIEIRNNDGHSIFENGNLINPSSNIHIGNNVWICQNVKILKGAHIGNNSVIALNALVSSGVYKNNVILAGIPAKIIKSNIYWSKELPN